MINIPAPLEKAIKSGNLKGLKPFAVMFRNKWHEESGGAGYFALDTTHPIDITAMIAKPNTLSMTLDVNEVAQYKANNVTLTLNDPFNKFIEETPKSYFPNGYQLYGSQVILYYGLDEINKTPLFVGVIKDLPTHKPENYEVDLKLISPLELLNDIEAKEFSNKYEGEILTADGFDDNNHPIYKTLHIGVGGFNAVYADGEKLFEGVDFEIKQINALSLPASITVINSDYYSAEISADYYCWKTGLTIEQIVSGLVALGGYVENTDIRAVLWNTAVTSQHSCTILGSFGFIKDGENFTSVCYRTYNRHSSDPQKYVENNYGFYAPNYKIEINAPLTIVIGDTITSREWVKNGFEIGSGNSGADVAVYQNSNIVQWLRFPYIIGGKMTVEKNGNLYTFTLYNAQGEVNKTETYTMSNELKFLTFWDDDSEINDLFYFTFRNNLNEDVFTKQISSKYYVVNDAFLVTNTSNFNNSTLKTYKANIQGEVPAETFYRSGSIYNNFNEWQQFNLGGDIGQTDNYFQMMINFPLSSVFYNFSQREIVGNNVMDFITNLQVAENEIFVYFLASSLILEFVNLSDKSILEALQDFALISGYEFGVDRQGVFFFKPRNQTTTPIYDLDKNEIVKIDNISKKSNDFFTKLTLIFAQRPLEFYANQGERPTPIDRYGVINKEINKPDIVSYDNPELAQAIGPQLLAIYSNLADIIQLTGKLNLGLELGDIVNVKRNYNLTAPEEASDFTKYACQNTYFRACKITGLNYNFDRKQITYTLRSVSNEENKPQYEFNEYIYDYAVQFGVKD